jgi:hypothetical protein
MLIGNIRYGFAANSSSTHSFFLFDRDVPSSAAERDAGLGWAAFTLAAPQGKFDCIAATLVVNGIGKGKERDAATAKVICERFFDGRHRELLERSCIRAPDRYTPEKLSHDLDVPYSSRGKSRAFRPGMRAARAKPSRRDPAVRNINSHQRSHACESNFS